jgi:hypothetical protein
MCKYSTFVIICSLTFCTRKGQDVTAMSDALGNVPIKFHIQPINLSSESSPGSDSVESAHYISPSLIKFHISPPSSSSRNSDTNDSTSRPPDASSRCEPLSQVKCGTVFSDVTTPLISNLSAWAVPSTVDTKLSPIQSSVLFASPVMSSLGLELSGMDNKIASSNVAVGGSSDVVVVADVLMDDLGGPMCADEETLPEYAESDSDSMATEDTASTTVVVPAENVMSSQHVSLSDLARSLYEDKDDPHISTEERDLIMKA